MSLTSRHPPRGWIFREISYFASLLSPLSLHLCPPTSAVCLGPTPLFWDTSLGR